MWNKFYYYKTFISLSENLHTTLEFFFHLNKKKKKVRPRVKPVDIFLSELFFISTSSLSRIKNVFLLQISVGLSISFITESVLTQNCESKYVFYILKAKFAKHSKSFIMPPRYIWYILSYYYNLRLFFKNSLGIRTWKSEVIMTNLAVKTQFNIFGWWSTSTQHKCFENTLKDYCWTGNRLPVLKNSEKKNLL